MSLNEYSRCEPEPEAVSYRLSAGEENLEGTATETAEAIFWLLSEAASYTTGSILDVSGGR